jgi:hypothetical protein
MGGVSSPGIPTVPGFPSTASVQTDIRDGLLAIASVTGGYKLNSYVIFFFE